MISQQLIKELQIILKEDCKKDLEIAEVSQFANNLAEYFDLLAKIYHRDD